MWRTDASLAASAVTAEEVWWQIDRHAVRWLLPSCSVLVVTWSASRLVCCRAGHCSSRPGKPQYSTTLSVQSCWLGRCACDEGLECDSCTPSSCCRHDFRTAGGSQLWRRLISTSPRLVACCQPRQWTRYWWLNEAGVASHLWPPLTYRDLAGVHCACIKHWLLLTILTIFLKRKLLPLLLLLVLIQ